MVLEASHTRQKWVGVTLILLLSAVIVIIMLRAKQLRVQLNNERLANEVTKLSAEIVKLRDRQDASDSSANLSAEIIDNWIAATDMMLSYNFMYSPAAADDGEPRGVDRVPERYDELIRTMEKAAERKCGKLLKQFRDDYPQLGEDARIMVLSAILELSNNATCELLGYGPRNNLAVKKHRLKTYLMSNYQPSAEAVMKLFARTARKSKKNDRQASGEEQGE